MRSALLTATLLAGFGLPAAAHATLTLTPAGVAAGFALSTFSSGPNYFDNLSSAVLPDGNLVAVHYSVGLLKYADADGQTPATTLIPEVSKPGVNVVASVGGHTYGGSLDGTIFEISSGLVTTTIATPGYTHTWGLWGNPVTGHLLGAGTTGVFDIDPLTGMNHLVAADPLIDGLTVSADGTIVYASAGNKAHILGWRISDGTLVFDSGPMTGQPDGVAMIIGGPLSGQLIVNKNDGTVGLLDPVTKAYTTIASGGAGGDFVSADLNDGSLFLADPDTTYRLRLADATIGSGTTDVPEPGSLGLLCGAVAAVTALRRRRR